MDRKAIIKQVKVRLDELTPFDESAITAVALIKPIETYIDNLLDESTIDILKIAPLHLLNSVSFTADANSGIIENNGVGYVICPKDYVRLAHFKMRGWQRAVNDPITEDDPQYQLQYNKHTRGGKAKPVVCERYDAEKGRVLELFSIDNKTVEYAYYIKRKKAEELQSDLTSALVWYCAYKVFQVMEMPQQGAVALQEAMNQLQIKTKE